MVVKFSDYGPSMQSSAAERVTDLAIQDSLKYRKAVKMRTYRTLHFAEPNFHRALLTVSPVNLLWAQWRDMLDALNTFLETWDCVALDFMILVKEVEIGRGNLAPGVTWSSTT